jgi:hypothetical protein
MDRERSIAFDARFYSIVLHASPHSFLYATHSYREGQDVSTYQTAPILGKRAGRLRR